MSEAAPPSRRKVSRLPSTLVDQIAAGEVVERPASVVKELVENALDAGCTHVRVEIDQGGLARLLVSDDGCGMDPDDARLAVERHATSKIARFEELSALRTFGFRGEALPSVASVSRFSLTTRTADADAAFSLVIHGGERLSEGPQGAAVGTTITVSDLFFNVPARRKFLKTTATEASHVAEVVHLAALAHPSVKFTFFKDGKLAREYLRTATLAERAREAHPGERLLPMAAAVSSGVSFEAWLSLPERARAGMTGLYLFVDGRPVRDRMLARAIAQGYGALLPAGRYPVGVFYLEVPPDTLDVNVHPQKAEVRFADPRAVFEAVTRGVREALTPSFSRPLGAIPFEAARDDRPGGDRTYKPADFLGAQAPLELRERVPAPGPDRSGPAVTPGNFAGGRERTGAGEGGSAPALFGRPTPAHAAPIAPAPVPPPAPFFAPIAAPPAPAPSEPGPSTLFGSAKFYANLRYLGPLRERWLLAEGAEALFVLDAHAMEERVLLGRLAAAGEGVSARTDLPLSFPLDARRAASFDGASHYLAALGFDLRRTGDRALAIVGVPQLLAGRSLPEALIHALFDLAARGAPLTAAHPLLACQAATRDELPSPDEVREFLDTLDSADFSLPSIHGRPLVTRLAFDELERKSR
jgi:DNA mismatch repair protein MutL